MLEFDLFVVINNINQWVLTDQSLFVNLIAPRINQLFQNKQTESGLFIIMCCCCSFLGCVFLNIFQTWTFFSIQDLWLGVIMLFCGTAVLSAQWVDQWLDEESAPGKMRVHARQLLLWHSTLQKIFLYSTLCQLPVCANASVHFEMRPLCKVRIHYRKISSHCCWAQSWKDFCCCLFEL